MPRIVALLGITINNFRSIKKASIDFPQESGLRYLCGNNLEEPALGANGVGKSSLWDAINWCLYGTSSKGLKVSNLTTWGEETSEVITNLSIDERIVFVKRTGPPTKLFINDEAQEQVYLDKLIGLSKLCFQHSVLFSQGQSLFPDLSLPERGELLEEILNLSFWSRCSESTTSELVSIEKELNKTRQGHSFIEGRVTGLETLSSLIAKREQWNIEQAKRLEEILTRRNTWEIIQIDKLHDLRKKRDFWRGQMNLEFSDLVKQEENWKTGQRKIGEEKVIELENLELELRSFGDTQAIKTTLIGSIRLEEAKKLVVEQNVSRIHFRLQQIQAENNILFNDVCYTCGQAITDVFKNEKRQKLQIEVSDLEEEFKVANIAISLSNSLLEGLQKQLAKAIEDNSIKQLKTNRELALEAEIQAILQLLKDNSPYKSQKDRVTNQVNPYDREIENTEKEVNPYSSQLDLAERSVNPYIITIEQNKKQRNDLLTELHTKQQVIKELESKALLTEYWKQGFKRLRIFLMHRVLSALEVEVNSAIGALGMDGWKVNLKSETETKSGTVKLGIQIQITSPNSNTSTLWEAWSGGESQRIRLALALGVSSLIQRSVGVWWNTEVFDEPSTHLSPQGVENLMEVLDYRAQTTNRCIWICDHTPLAFSNFKNIWTAVREKGVGTRFEYN